MTTGLTAADHVRLSLELLRLRQRPPSGRLSLGHFALHAVNIALVYLLGLLLFQETRLNQRLALALAASGPCIR